MKFFNNIDLQKNQLQKARLENSEGAPVSDENDQGRVIYDTVNKYPQYFNGRIWEGAVLSQKAKYTLVIDPIDNGLNLEIIREKG